MLTIFTTSTQEKTKKKQNKARGHKKSFGGGGHVYFPIMSLVSWVYGYVQIHKNANIIQALFVY